jgi:glutamate decarboxylase
MRKTKSEALLSKFFDPKKTTVFSKKLKKLLDQYNSQAYVSKEYDIKYLEQVFSFQFIPREGISQEDYLMEIEHYLLPSSTQVSVSNFMGHMTSALPNFISEISRLVTSLNQNVVKIETSQSATFYERQAIAMLHHQFYENKESFYQKHIHHIDSTLGIITSGGTLANVTALQCARNRIFPEFEKKGINTEQRAVVICSELAHYSIQKAMGLLGLGTENLIRIPTDENNKMRIDFLKKAIGNCHALNQQIIALIGIAGTTECGSIDPLEEMAAIAAANNIYFHVDAAWGGPIKFSETYRHLIKGIEKADSITIDGHKQLYLPMGIGLILFQHPKTASLIEKESEYIIRKTSIDLGKRSIEGSRPANSFYLQAGLKLLGKRKYAWLIDKGIQTARQMSAIVLVQPDFELLTPSETNIFLYRYVPESVREKTVKVNQHLNDLNKALQQKQMQHGRTFVSYTTVPLETYQKQRIVGLRVVVANPFIEVFHFEEILKEQREIIKKLSHST